MVSASFSLTGKYLVLIHGGNGVQISKKIPQKNKRTELKNNLTPFLQENYGFVVRTSAGTASLEELREEAVHLQKEYEQSSCWLAKWYGQLLCALKEESIRIKTPEHAQQTSVFRKIMERKLGATVYVTPSTVFCH